MSTRVALAACVAKCDEDAFLGWLEGEWRASSKHFKRVQRTLLAAIEGEQVGRFSHITKSEHDFCFSGGSARQACSLGRNCSYPCYASSASRQLATASSLISAAGGCGGVPGVCLPLHRPPDRPAAFAACRAAGGRRHEREPAAGGLQQVGQPAADGRQVPQPSCSRCSLSHTSAGNARPASSAHGHTKAPNQPRPGPASAQKQTHADVAQPAQVPPAPPYSPLAACIRLPLTRLPLAL